MAQVERLRRIVDRAMEHLTYYDTFENREEHFRQSVQSLLPRKFSGPAVFWKDMAAAISSISDLPHNPIACISSNPRDCLAYTFVEDLLSATTLSLKKRDGDELLDRVVEQYFLAPIREQQIHTLSGGEVVRLALARNSLISDVADQVIVSSPLTWLSSSSLGYYDRFIETYVKKGKTVEILAMEGEDDLSPEDISVESNVTAELTIRNLKIRLNSDEFDRGVPETWAAVGDIELELVSPCLVTGENGTGKSLLAKALSNAVYCDGEAAVKTRGYRGKPRLLFQDVFVQTLLRPFSVLMATAKCTSGEDTRKVYQKLIDRFVDYFESQGQVVPHIGDRSDNAKTLLEYKFILAAIRLCEVPTALLLDEPSWGLSRDTAIAFVRSVVAVAHEKGTAVILISHKSWWKKMSGTRLELSKTLVEEGNIKYEFVVSPVQNGE